MFKSILVSTTNQLEGYRIVDYCGVCSARAVVGAGLFSDFEAGIVDFIGGTSSLYEDRLSELYVLGQEKLKGEALKVGANAIVGVHIDVNQISGKNMQMFMVTTYGTGVYVEPLSKVGYNQGAGDVGDSEPFIAMNALGMTAKQQATSGVFERVKSVSDVERVFQDLLMRRLSIGPDTIFDVFSKGQLPFTQQGVSYLMGLYLNQYDHEVLSAYMYTHVLGKSSHTPLEMAVIKTYLLPDYTFLLEEITKRDIENYVLYFGNALLSFKPRYYRRDFEALRALTKHIEALLEAQVGPAAKGLLGGEKWLCVCQNKVSVNDTYCHLCDRARNGIKKPTHEALGGILEFLKSIDHQGSLANFG